MKVRSVTNAQRAVRLLKRAGRKASITRIKHPKKGEGCGYAVLTDTADLDKLTEYLEDNGIAIIGVEQV